MARESATRTCTRCGTTVEAKAECPQCRAWYEARPDPDTMTAEERVAELRSWTTTEIDFEKIHRRIGELVCRDVLTHELARPDLLEHEILTGQRPSLEGIIAKLPADMPVIVVRADEEAPS
jgi:hypothetical protein